MEPGEVRVTAKRWNPETRKVDAPTEFVARNRMEAIRWINLMQDWMREFEIDGVPF